MNRLFFHFRFFRENAVLIQNKNFVDGIHLLRAVVQRCTNVLQLSMRPSQGWLECIGSDDCRHARGVSFPNSVFAASPSSFGMSTAVWWMISADYSERMENARLQISRLLGETAERLRREMQNFAKMANFDIKNFTILAKNEELWRITYEKFVYEIRYNFCTRYFWSFFILRIVIFFFLSREKMFESCWNIVNE